MIGQLGVDDFRGGVGHPRWCEMFSEKCDVLFEVRRRGELPPKNNKHHHAHLRFA